MNSFIVVDSGSTTSRWAQCTSGKAIKTVKIKGINPSYQTNQEIEQLISTLPQAFKAPLSDIYFYGSGCASRESCIRISEILHCYFGESCFIKVECDILGVAFSLFRKSTGIACIMGTGSNVCIYDGKKITGQFGGMGYLIDDYGSGFDIGRRFFSHLYSNRLPRLIEEDFSSTYALSRSDMLGKIYQNETFPNRYIASFVPFIAKYQNEPQIHDLILGSFSDFIREVLPKSLPNYPIAFSGSIAYYFQNILKSCCQRHSITIQDIVAHPLEGLIHFHSKQNLK